MQNDRFYVHFTALQEPGDGFYRDSVDKTRHASIHGVIIKADIGFKHPALREIPWVF